MINYIGEGSVIILSITRDSDTLVLALATLGGGDKDRNDPNCPGKPGRQYPITILRAFSHINPSNVNEK
jgi:hypothetical protein